MKIAIIYGSCGGHARDCAIELYHSINSHNTSIFSSADFDFQEFDILVFVVSTAGHGAFPRSFMPVWDRLCLVNRLDRFCIFGLGDSRYPNYNYAARRLQARLQVIGFELIPLCLGDDQDPLGYRAMFQPWKIKLFELLNISPKLRFPKIFNISFDMKNQNRNSLISPKFNCRLTRKDIVVDTTDKKVAEMDVLLDSEFNIGDVLSVYYHVDNTFINKIFERFNFSDITVNLTINDLNYKEMGYHRISKGSYRLSDLLKYYFDINSILSPWIMTLLSDKTKFDLHKDKLFEFGTPNGLYLFNKYVDYEKRSFLDVLIDFNSIELTLEELINLIPPLFPRLYSIANIPGCISLPQPYHLIFNRAKLLSFFTANAISNYIDFPPSRDSSNEKFFKADNKIAQLSVAFVESYTTSGRRVPGRCSDWLVNRLQVDEMFYADLLPCSMSIASKNAIISKSCIFLSTGTGFSSCRPWILRKFIDSLSHDGDLRDNLVIAGFRRKKEVLFQRDWLLYSRVGTIDLALSREMSIGGSRVYIQHLLQKHSQLIWNLLLRGSVILVSGRSHPMPSQLLDSLIDILTQFYFSKDEAKTFVSNLESTNRIIFDTW